jgi:hypothetical protein
VEESREGKDGWIWGVDPPTDPAGIDFEKLVFGFLAFTAPQSNSFFFLPTEWSCGKGVKIGALPV